MTCSEISKSTPLYLAGELDTDTEAAFADHLKSCADCRLYVERDAEIDKLIRESMANDATDSSSVDRRIRARVRLEQRNRRWLLAGAGIAAVLALAVASYRIAARPSPIFAAAAHDHRVELVEKQPRKWTADPAALAPLAARVGVPLARATAFTPAGYHFSGGRLCLLNGQIFLHLVYAGAGGDVSLFLRNDQGGGDSARVRENRYDAEYVAGFRNNTLSAVFVTDQPGGTAIKLAQSAAATL
jgi:anti-sigma factor RsiW